jgi:alkyl sulfatase BDS1-like metallo-beta-lactamase superfamily hydrolase
MDIFLVTTAMRIKLPHRELKWGIPIQPHPKVADMGNTGAKEVTMTQGTEQRRDSGLGGVPGQEEECTPDIIWLGIGSSSAVLTGEGVVVVDVPMGNRAGWRIVEAIRRRTQASIHTIIYTHGHMDHIWGIAPLLSDAQEQGNPKPKIVAHELVPKRFDRYQRLRGQHEYINRIQFAIPKSEQVLPSQFFYPDVTYSESMQFKLGGLTFELYHYMGETDDGTWVWIPERKAALIGDLLIGGCPNVGNPFKVQRYALEWAEALERVAGRNPDFVIPAHGPVRRGQQAQEICLDTAKYLRYIEDEVVRLLNEGCWIEEILERVRIPEDLARKPWLVPIYGHTTFIIHGVYRRYAGWYNGNPSELFPSKSSEIAAEVVTLGGIEQLLERASKLQQEGNIQLALHLADFVIQGSENDSKRKEALLLKAKLLDAKADAETSSIARNIFRNGAQSAAEEARSL